MGFNLAWYSSFFLVLVLIFVPIIGVTAGLEVVFGIIIPYLAILIFFVGMVYKVVIWARTPVPFRIPTTCGQQKSLPWLKRTLRDRLENPFTTWEVIGRMILEVFFFRSLFRNIKAQLRDEPSYPEKKRLVYWSSKWLWLGAIAFHYSFLVILIRHLWLFTEPVPSFVRLVEHIDSFFQLYVPAVYISGIVLIVALTYLLLRRIFDPKLRYISLFSDYLPLFWLLAIGISGILMRYFFKVDMTAVKELTLGLASLHPHIPKEHIGVIFYVHLFLVSSFFAYFPFTKLAHMAGIFMSMTRNLANNSRAVRHVNPWNYPVRVKTYLDQENDWRENMAKFGLPLEISVEEAKKLGKEKLEELADEEAARIYNKLSGNRHAPVFPETEFLRKQIKEE